MAKTIKRALSLFLCAVLLLGALPLTAVHAADPNSGTCGDHLAWTYDTAAATLTISGTGDMYDYYASSLVTTAPWQTYCSTMQTLVIESGVTSIGEDAFCGCSGVTSVSIPNSVTSIGDAAFYYCTALTSVTIPNSVTSIGRVAFFNTACYNNDSNWENNVLYIGNHLIEAKEDFTGAYKIRPGTKTVADYGFYGCDGLTGVTIPDSVTSIGEYAFYVCKGLTAITVAAGNANYSSDAFGALYNKNKTELIQYPVGNARAAFTIPNSVLSIGSGAFRSNSGLTSITVPDSVTSIGDYAFAWCDGLVSVTIGNSVTSIGDSAFYQCTGLTSVTIPNSVTSIGDSAFNQCTGLTSITISDSVRNIGNGAFVGTAYWNNDINWDNNVLYIGNHLIQERITSTGSFMSGAYEIRPGTKTIADTAFKNNNALTSITIPDSVTSIGNEAFYLCSALTSVTIPNSVTNIGDWAFYYCNGLTSMTLGNSVTSIGDWAFEYCYSLTSVTIPDSVTSIGDWAFGSCLGLTSMTLGSSVTSIGDAAFYNCSHLTNVTIPDSVTSIGNYPFASCTRLTAITVAANNPSYSSDAFGVLYNKDKTKLIQYPLGNSNTAFTIPSGVTSINDSAFYKCTGLTNITIPDSVKNIGSSAFYDCKNLSDVYYAGSESQWNRIIINSGNDPLTNATIHFNCLNTLTYNANGGTGAPAAQTGNGSITLSGTKPTRDGYTFKGWATSASATTAQYQPGASFDLTESTTLYAVWEKNTTPAQPKVTKVEVGDVTMNYKDSITIKPTITADAGAKYTIKYSSSDPSKVKIDEKSGEVTGLKRGSATITCTVTDSSGNTAADTCKVTVKYTALQWIIKILLFGWIWY